MVLSGEGLQPDDIEDEAQVSPVGDDGVGEPLTGTESVRDIEPELSHGEGGDQRVPVEPATAFGGAVALSGDAIERAVSDTAQFVIGEWIQVLESVSEALQLEVVAVTLVLLSLVVLAHALEAFF